MSQERKSAKSHLAFCDGYGVVSMQTRWRQVHFSHSEYDAASPQPHGASRGGHVQTSNFRSAGRPRGYRACLRILCVGSLSSTERKSCIYLIWFDLEVCVTKTGFFIRCSIPLGAIFFTQLHTIEWIYVQYYSDSFLCSRLFPSRRHTVSKQTILFWRDESPWK